MVSPSAVRPIDRPLLISVVLLIAIGLVLIASASQVVGLRGGHYYLRQLLWIAFGVVLMVGSIMVSMRTVQALSYMIYFVLLILLVYVGMQGGGPSARRWIDFGGFHIQPSELAKIALVLALARYLSSRRFAVDRFRSLVIPAVMTAIPFTLVLLEPDLGTALVFPAILFTMLIWTGVSGLRLALLVTPVVSIICSFHTVSWAIFLLVFVAGCWVWRAQLVEMVSFFLLNSGVGILAPVLWGGLKSYQRARIVAFLNPSLDPHGTGWHIIQSKIAIGSGGLIGKGVFHGTQKGLAFLPQQHTDFVFSVLGEEAGFWGCIVVLGLFFILIRRGILIARDAWNDMTSLVAIGLVSILVFQVFVNIGMTLGLFPVVGLPLPFLSYGGSSLLSMMIIVGLLLNVGRRRFE